MPNTFIRTTAHVFLLLRTVLLPAVVSVDTATTVSNALLPPSGRTGVLIHELNPEHFSKLDAFFTSGNNLALRALQ